MEVSPEIILAGLALLGMAFQYFGVITRMKERLSRIETKTDLFWTVIEAKMPDLLKAPHALRKDELLDNMKAGACNLEDVEELIGILVVEEDTARPDLIVAKALVLGRLGQIRSDLLEGKRRGRWKRLLSTRWP